MYKKHMERLVIIRRLPLVRPNVFKACKTQRPVGGYIRKGKELGTSKRDVAFYRKRR